MKELLIFQDTFQFFLAKTFYLKLFHSLNAPGKSNESQVQGSIFSWNQIYLKNQSIVFRTLTKQLTT